jgi:hypothetical protein
MGVLDAEVHENRWSPYGSSVWLVRHVHLRGGWGGEKMGSRSLRWRSIQSSSLVKRLVSVRRDMLQRGRLVSGVTKEGRIAWMCMGVW